MATPIADQQPAVPAFDRDDLADMAAHHVPEPGDTPVAA